MEVGWFEIDDKWDEGVEIWGWGSMEGWGLDRRFGNIAGWMMFKGGFGRWYWIVAEVSRLLRNS